MTVRRIFRCAAEGLADRTAETAAMMFFGCLGHVSASDDQGLVPVAHIKDSARVLSVLPIPFSTLNVDIIEQILI